MPLPLESQKQVSVAFAHLKKCSIRKGIGKESCPGEAVSSGLIMKKIDVENAIGKVLAHDVTRIVPGKFKGVGFKKGHIIQGKDIAELKKIGKNHLYVLELSPDMIHEDDAALRICEAVCGESVAWTDPVEGKSNIVCKTDGLLKIDASALMRINSMGEIIISTLKSNTPCRKDQIVAATRIIPLATRRDKIERLEAIVEREQPVIKVLPFKPMRVGAVVTGTEVHNGIIHDAFDEFVKPVIIRHGSTVVNKIIVPDDPHAISGAINQLAASKCELIVTTGGLSVDPDDVTREGILQTGAKLVSYGAPILPGAMFLYALYNNIPIIGLPACVYYYRATVFDLVLPRILAGETITREDIVAMGHGGLCLNCKQCRYPVCPFGK